MLHIKNIQKIYFFQLIILGVFSGKFIAFCFTVWCAASTVLVKITDYYFYFWVKLYGFFRLCLSKTDAEKYNIKKSRTFHFEFGLHLAWMLTIFTVQSMVL